MRPTADTLAPAQRRIARRVARRLRAGELVFAVGCDVWRRQAFEAALIGEGLEIASRKLELDGDPWMQITALAQRGKTPCVSWGEGHQQGAFIATLNLGRERFAELSAGLLIWIGGLDAIEAFPKQAPDLWAYRGGVEWVVSIDDFWRATTKQKLWPVYEFKKKVPAGERRARLEDELSQLPKTEPRRFSLLSELAILAEQREDFEQAERIGSELGFWGAILISDTVETPEKYLRMLGGEDSGHETKVGFARDLLQPIEALLASISDFQRAVSLDDALAADYAIPVIDDLRALGLTADALMFADFVVTRHPLGKRRELIMRAAIARMLVDAGTWLGVHELWRLFEDHRAALRSVPSLAVPRLTLATVDLICDDLVHLVSVPAEANELRELGVELARTAEERAMRADRVFWAGQLRQRAAALLTGLGRYREALPLLERNVEWSKTIRRPIGEVCSLHLELARVHAASGDFDWAFVELDRAERSLSPSEPTRTSPAIWSELLLTRARITAASGDPKLARAHAEDARDRMARAGLAARQLDALQLLAEPFPHEGPEALPAREEAAAAALALVAPSGLIEPHARALANFARVHAECGRLEPAAAMLAEARELISERRYGPTREHVDRVGEWIDSVCRA